MNKAFLTKCCVVGSVLSNNQGADTAPRVQRKQGHLQKLDILFYRNITQIF